MDYFVEEREAFNDYLREQWEKPESKLEESMSYSLLAGGKRLRPVLFLATAALYRDDWRNLLPFALGIEMIHTYSLIHDDLPAMDNDDFRRGRPTNHKIYGEALAILAGDALLTGAFGFMSDIPGEKGDKLLRAVNLAALRSGGRGMVYGQSLDVAAEGQELTLNQLREIHYHKTGDLMVLSLTCGAILGGAAEKEIEAWEKYGENLGLAFQIVDDILDEVGSFADLGKTIHSDAESEKNTYVTLLGLSEAKKAAAAAIEEANASLKEISRDTDVFQRLSQDLLVRKA